MDDTAGDTPTKSETKSDVRLSLSTAATSVDLEKGDSNALVVQDF